jgi:hypothetical protein
MTYAGVLIDAFMNGLISKILNFKVNFCRFLLLKEVQERVFYDFYFNKSKFFQKESSLSYIEYRM